MMFIAVAMIFTACNLFGGKEVARLAINEVSTKENIITKEATLDLKQGEEIHFWSDMDVEFDGDPAFEFYIHITKDSAVMDLKVNPFERNVTMNEVTKTINGHTDTRFEANNYQLKITESGTYKIEAILISHNQNLTINKAELVIKK